jgi:glycosyltransferase involved in cell wall biosynthesis
MEGGANVISEAIVAGVPVVSSRIEGSIGLLGADYPGYFPVGDTRRLALLLQRAEQDSSFYEELKRRCRALQPLFQPREEKKRWEKLLGEVGVGNQRVQPESVKNQTDPS